MKLAGGVDLIEIHRIQEAMERHGRRFLERIFTPKELTETGKNPASLAARFAAKEAVAKALGTGIGAISWREIEILRNEARQPILHLHGKAAQRAADLGLKSWAVSLSHTQDFAIAMVVAIGAVSSEN